RAPGQDAGRRVENLVRRIRLQIGGGHGANRALAEAPRRRGIGFRDLLLHLHEDVERGLRAAKRLRQQRPIKPVLDQGFRDGRRQPPGPLDLVSLARDQGLKRAGALDETKGGGLVHCASLPFLSTDQLGGMVIHLARKGKVCRSLRRAMAGAEDPTEREQRTQYRLVRKSTPRSLSRFLAGRCRERLLPPAASPCCPRPKLQPSR